MLTRLRNSIQLSLDELINKVSWPTWEDLQSSAVVVLIASLIIALLIFIIDTLLEQGFNLIYSALA